jgi:hypothetical protein
VDHFALTSRIGYGRRFTRRPTAFAVFQPKLISTDLPRARTNRVSASSEAAMDDDRLTERLAAEVLGWKAAPDRFIKSGRSWIPRWRFRPFQELSSAFELLNHVTEHYRITCERRIFCVEARIGKGRIKASGQNLAQTITTAVAESFGLKVEA